MKTFLKKVAVLSIILAAVACSEDVVNNIQYPGGDETLKEINITGNNYQFENETRSSVFITESGASFVWNDNDTVGIFPNKGDQVSFAMVEGAGTQTATFSGGGWSLKASSTYSAYYPYNFYNRDMTNIPVSYIGQTQKGNANTDHIGAYDFMAASVATPSDGSVAFDMNHLGCLVQLVLTVPEPSTLNRVTLNSSANFTATGLIDLSSVSPAIIAKTQTTSMDIVLKDITTTSADEKVYVYFMIAPVDFSGSELAVTVTYEGGATAKADITGKNLQAGKAYQMKASLPDAVGGI